MVNNETFHILLDNRGFDAIAWKLTKYSFLLAVQKMLELGEVKKVEQKDLVLKDLLNVSENNLYVSVAW